MTQQEALAAKIRTYLRRESYVWLRVHGNSGLNFGWVIGCRDGGVIFKDDEGTRPKRIKLENIEGCGIV